MKIGVWNTAFLGDAVLTLPLLHTLAQGFPGAELHFFVRAGLEPLFAAQPELAGVRGFAKRDAQSGAKGARGMGRAVARMGLDLWISAHTSLRSGLVSRWSSIPRRIGYSRPWYNAFFYTHTVDRAFGRMDEIERLLRLAGPLNVPLVREPRLVLPERAVKRAGELFAELGDGPVLGVHPGSTWPTKQWPEEYFSEVAGRAARDGARVLVFGGRGEEDVAARVARGAGCPERVRDISGTLSLPELAAHLGRLDCYLTNDSGPMHLAWVQGTPVSAVFGPTARDLGFFPRGEGSTVLETELACRPCSLHGPRQCPQGHHRCMRDVTPDMVWADVRRKLEAARA
ncbi:glycosyltransferase family 9 protein [Desulfocurvus sp. DL9XJH121]